MSVLDVFGINWKILLFQIINLLIALFLLKTFALKPFSEILKKRREKIEKGLEDAQEAEQMLKDAQGRAGEIVKKAEGKKEQILEEAEERAKKEQRRILSEAEKEKGIILIEGREQVYTEREQMKRDFQKDFLSVTEAVVEKILKEKIDEKKDGKIIEEAISNI
ncbi:MAG: ATP synthase F0 subunit B [Candidatus Nealsonbacteria bacterium CG_4_8_14_3_um_filter_39_7]|nr:MAG: ATP synthase F0 subunit B [Candidatus Nealsonbacteria bacterium CG_4_8_14_3_um_filter_39_7]